MCPAISVFDLTMNTQNTSNNDLRLFRVYSPRAPRREVRVWAHDPNEAPEVAKSQHPSLARFPDLKAKAA